MDNPELSEESFHGWRNRKLDCLTEMPIGERLGDDKSITLQVYQPIYLFNLFKFF